jgi:hypothetical protein
MGTPSKSATVKVQMIDCGYDLFFQQSIDDQEDDGADGGDENSTEVERLNLPEPDEAAQKTADDRAGDADEDRNDNPAWSFPGMTNFAIAAAMRPRKIQEKIPMLSFLGQIAADLSR